MSEAGDLVRNLRQLVELDRAFGVEFVLTRSGAAPAGASVAAKPVVAAPAAPATPVAPAASAAPVAPVRPAAVPPAGRSPAAPAPVVAAPRPVPASAPGAPAVAGAPVTTPWAPTAEQLAAPAEQVLALVAAETAGCLRCGLCKGRTHAVPGEGAAQPELLFVGEGPGADEDRLGRPFVGAAGQLLDKMIVAMGFTRAQVHIANVVKCRPPGNRVPEPAEIAACMPFLRAQIAVLKPKVICTLGNTPLRALMGDDSLGITRVRGTRLQYQGITLIPTFHPSYLLRNEQAKKPCWEDLQTVLAELGRTAPKR